MGAAYNLLAPNDYELTILCFGETILNRPAHTLNIWRHQNMSIYRISQDVSLRIGFSFGLNHKVGMHPG
jgi:hypothetical protein